MEEISSSLIKEAVPVTINKNIFNYDELIIVGPVSLMKWWGFPEGINIFFQVLPEKEITHKFHWFSALITNLKLSDTKTLQ